MTAHRDLFWQRCAVVVAALGIFKALVGIGALLVQGGSSHALSQAAFTFVLIASLAAALALLLTSPVLAALLALASAAYAGGFLAQFWAAQLLPIEIFVPAMLWLLACRAEAGPAMQKLLAPMLGLCLAIFLAAAAGLMGQDVLYFLIGILSLPPLLSCLRLHRILSIDRRLRAMLLAIALPLGFLCLQVFLSIHVISAILPLALDPHAIGAAINGIAGLGVINVARVAWQEKEAEMQAKQRIRTAEDFVEWGLGVFAAEVDRSGLSVAEDAELTFRQIYAESGAKAARAPRAFVLVEEQLTEVMTQQAAMAVMAARWKGAESVGADEVRRAVLGHRMVKAGTWLCPPKGALEPLQSEEAA